MISPRWNGSGAANGSLGVRAQTRTDHWLRLGVELAGAAAVAFGGIVLIRRLGVWDEVPRAAIETGMGGLLITAGASLILERRAQWHQLVVARLAALLFAVPPVAALVLLIVAGHPRRAIDLTPAGALLVVVLAAAIGLTLPRQHSAMRLGLLGILAAFAVAAATAMDVSRLVFGEAPLVLAPVSRAALGGLALLAAGLLVDSLRRWISELGAPVRWLPLAVALFLGTFAVGLWRSVAVLEGSVAEPLGARLSTFFLVGGLLLAGITGFAVFLAQESLSRLLDEARRLRASEKRYRELSRKQARAALARSEARYRELLDSVSVGVFQSTVDGELLSANPAMVEMLGYDSPQELLGIGGLCELCVDRADGRALLERVRERGEIEEMRIRLRHREGATIIARLSSRLVEDPPWLDEPSVAGTLVEVGRQGRARRHSVASE